MTPAEKRREFSRKYERERRLRNPEYYLWRNAKQRARKKDLDFDIEVSDIIIPQFCPLLNIPIIHKIGHGTHRNPNAASLDRINNQFGYTKGNILVVSWRANFIKGDASIEELELLLTNLKTIK
jgi:hypothetical protein